MDEKEKITNVALDAEDEEIKKKEAAEAAKKKKKRFRLKHPRRFMVWIDLVGLLLLAVGLYLGIRYFINQKFISAYESGNYETEKELSLTNINLVEPYLPYYNLGNVAYQEEDYTRAIAYYKQALDQDPPKYKECPIRINLALSLIKRIDFNDLSTEKKLNNAIQTLRTARTILTAHECAGPVEDDGHSPEAEQLKHDIDEMLKKLQEPQDQQDQQENNDQDDQQDQNKDDQNQEEENTTEDNKETDEERKTREKLEEQQRNNQQQRSNEQREYEEKYGNPSNGGGNGGDGMQPDLDSSGKYW
ncbi:MAG: tetratricopeptide repeat protein [Eubacterium sp.]|nr:tetratricopeptide repeat protein [Eubacterium sp.]